MKYFAKISEKEYELQVGNEGNCYTVTIGKDIQHVDFQQIEGTDLFSMIVDGKSYTYSISKNSNGYIIRNKGNAVEVIVNNEREQYLSKLVKVLPNQSLGCYHNTCRHRKSYDWLIERHNYVFKFH